MHLKAALLGLLKSIFGDLRRATVGLILGAIVLSYGGIYLFAKNLFDATIRLAYTATPLWVTIVVSLAVGGYAFLKKRKRQLPSDISLHQAFGVLWNNGPNMHCLSCGTLLKNSTMGPSIFFCADPACNSKHVLKDDNGKELTKREAIDSLKPANE